MVLKGKVRAISNRPLHTRQETDLPLGGGGKGTCFKPHPSSLV